MLTESGHILLPLARAAISRELGLRPPLPKTDADWLRSPGSAFVTLTQNGQLRGRSGTLEPLRPLHDDVAANAIIAAFRDPRFKPLASAELENTRIEVSVLSPLEVMAAADESAVLGRLRAGIDGLAFRYGHHRSTFLPEAWSQFGDAAEFMAQLKYKAGLPPDFWDPAIALYRYTATRWHESDA